MRVAILCNSDSLSIPTIRSLTSMGRLVSIAIPEKSKSFLHDAILSVTNSPGLVLINSRKRKEQLEDWLLLNKPDVVWVFGCPWKIPTEIIKIPKYGFVNFHFGALPKYGGADPIFWQIKNQEKKVGLSIHRMDEKIDNGQPIWYEETDALPGENYDMLCLRMGWLASGIVDVVIDKIQAEVNQHTQQDDCLFPFWNKPKVEDLTISWSTQSSAEIIALINASNSKYGGISTSIRSMEVRILEADLIEVNHVKNEIAGTIVHADMVYGVIVACSDNRYIRLTVMHLREGYVSGAKLVTFGLKAGERFD